MKKIPYEIAVQIVDAVPNIATVCEHNGRLGALPVIVPEHIAEMADLVL